MKSPIQLFVALAVLLATATVAAQVYKWVDKDGKVQYSDMPPPPSVSKTDPKKLNTGANSAAPAAANTTAAAAAAAQKSPQDRSKDADKRRIEDAEKARKDEEAQKAVKQNEERCGAATRYKGDLDSGRPIARNNDQGERTYMSDEERSTEIARIKSVMAESCNK